MAEFGLMDPEYLASLPEIQRRKALAAALQEQGMTSPDPSRTAGRYVVQQSPIEGLARLGKAYFGKQLADKAGAQERDAMVAALKRQQEAKDASTERVLTPEQAKALGIVPTPGAIYKGTSKYVTDVDRAPKEARSLEDSIALIEARAKANADAAARTAQTKTDIKKAAAAPKAKTAMDKFVTNTDETIKLAMDILEVPPEQRGGELNPQALAGNVGGAAGPSSVLANIPWTSFADKKALVDRLLARSGFNELQEMRQASPTGGALGNVTEKELYYLQQAAAALQNSQSKDQFARELVNYVNVLRRAKTAVADQFSQEFAPAEQPDPGAAPAAAPTRKVVRTGTRNGKKVVQYDDGSIEEAP